jgi:hypothetical protein
LLTRLTLPKSISPPLFEYKNPPLSALFPAASKVVPENDADAPEPKYIAPPEPLVELLERIVVDVPAKVNAPLFTYIAPPSLAAILFIRLTFLSNLIVCPFEYKNPPLFALFPVAVKVVPVNDADETPEPKYIAPPLLEATFSVNAVVPLVKLNDELLPVMYTAPPEPLAVLELIVDEPEKVNFPLFLYIAPPSPYAAVLFTRLTFPKSISPPLFEYINPPLLALFPAASKVVPVNDADAPEAKYIAPPFPLVELLNFIFVDAPAKFNAPPFAYIAPPSLSAVLLTRLTFLSNLIVCPFEYKNPPLLPALFPVAVIVEPEKDAETPEAKYIAPPLLDATFSINAAALFVNLNDELPVIYIAPPDPFVELLWLIIVDDPSKVKLPPFLYIAPPLPFVAVLLIRLTFPKLIFPPLFEYKNPPLFALFPIAVKAVPENDAAAPEPK